MAAIFKKNMCMVLTLSFLLSGIPSSALCGEGKGVISLSLRDAISVVLKNSKDIQFQEKEIEVAHTGILAARSEFLPKLNVTGGYMYNGGVLALGSNVSQGLKKDIGVFTGYKNDNKLGTVINESLYNGGANRANLKQAFLRLSAQKETLRAKKLDMEFETKRLYFGLLFAYEVRCIAQDLVSQAQSHYEDVKNKFTQGESSKFDLLQSKVQVSKLMPELVRAKNSVDLIMAELKKLLALKSEDAISLEDKLTYTLIEVNEEEFLRQAYLNAPEMVLKSLGVDISAWSIQMSKAVYRPQVNAEWGYSYRSNNPGSMFNARHNNWNAGVSVTIPLFDGFSTKAKVDEAKIRYAQATLEKQSLTDQIVVDIRKACLDLKQAESIINSQKDNIEEAKEALRIAQVSYDNGEGTNLDILDAQVSLSQVEKNLSEGKYDYSMARAFLDRVMGREYVKGEEGGRE